MSCNIGFSQIIPELEPNDDISQSGVITLSGNETVTGNIMLFSGDIFDTWALADGINGELTIDLVNLGDIIVVEWSDAARSNNTRVWYLPSGSSLTLNASNYYALVVDVFSANFAEDPYQVSLSLDTNLPVELSSFEAHKAEGAVQLVWETETELENSHFDIERSSNGSEFTAIGRMLGAGTTNINQKYQFMDENPLSTENYYRLKQVDYDGTTTYSEVKQVSFEAYLGEIEIFPNPTTDFITIKIPEGIKEEINISVFDANGRQMMSQEQTTDFLNTRLNVSQLGAGQYALRIESEQGVNTQRFTVLK